MSCSLAPRADGTCPLVGWRGRCQLHGADGDALLLLARLRGGFLFLACASGVKALVTIHIRALVISQLVLVLVLLTLSASPSPSFPLRLLLLPLWLLLGAARSAPPLRFGDLLCLLPCAPPCRARSSQPSRRAEEHAPVDGCERGDAAAHRHFEGGTRSTIHAASIRPRLQLFFELLV